MSFDGDDEAQGVDSIVAEEANTTARYYQDGRTEMAVLVREMQTTALEGAEEAASRPKWWARRPSRTAILALFAVLGVAGFAAVRWGNEFFVHRRIAEDADRIARRIEDYRGETNLYPDAATWQRWVAGDGSASLLDPWERPYLYDVDSRAFSITTQGADGRPGGWGEDQDLTFVFRYLNSRMALPRAEPTRQPAER